MIKKPSIPVPLGQNNINDQFAVRSKTTSDDMDLTDLSPDSKIKRKLNKLHAFERQNILKSDQIAENLSDGSLSSSSEDEDECTDINRNVEMAKIAIQRFSEARKCISDYLVNISKYSELISDTNHIFIKY